MKKIISILLMLCLLLPLSIATMAEEDEPIKEVTYEWTEADGGYVLEIASEIVFGSPEEALDSIQFAVLYDAAKLRYVDAVQVNGMLDSEVITGDFLWSIGNQEAGKLMFSAASALGAQKSGIILRLKFEALADAPSTDTVSVQEIAYSIYNRTTKEQVCYSIKATEEVPEEIPITTEEQPVHESEPSTKPEESESGWSRFIKSLFGDSCCAAE